MHSHNKETSGDDKNMTGNVQLLNTDANSNGTIEGGGLGPFEVNSGTPVVPFAAGQSLRSEAAKIGAFEVMAQANSSQHGVSQSGFPSNLATPTDTHVTGKSTTSQPFGDPNLYLFQAPTKEVSFGELSTSNFNLRLASSKAGYRLWKLHVQNHLSGFGLWDFNSQRPLDVPGHSGVLAFLLTNMDLEFQSLFDDCNTADQVWNLLENLPVHSVSQSQDSLSASTNSIFRKELTEFAQWKVPQKLKGRADYSAWVAECIAIFTAYDASDSSSNCLINCNNSNLFIRGNVDSSLLPLLSPTASAAENWTSLSVLNLEGPLAFIDSLSKLRDWKPSGDSWTEKHLVAIKSAASHVLLFNPNKNP